MRRLIKLWHLFTFKFEADIPTCLSFFFLPLSIWCLTASIDVIGHSFHSKWLWDQLQERRTQNNSSRIAMPRKLQTWSRWCLLVNVKFLKSLSQKHSKGFKKTFQYVKTILSQKYITGWWDFRPSLSIQWWWKRCSFHDHYHCLIFKCIITLKY